MRQHDREVADATPTQWPSIPWIVQRHLQQSGKGYQVNVHLTHTTQAAECALQVKGVLAFMPLGSMVLMLTENESSDVATGAVVAAAFLSYSAILSFRSCIWAYHTPGMIVFAAAAAAALYGMIVFFAAAAALYDCFFCSSSSSVRYVKERTQPMRLTWNNPLYGVYGCWV